MQRIRPVDLSEVKGRTEQLVECAGIALGDAPNMIRTLATSPAALEGYLTLNSALSAGQLTSIFRQKIALAVAQANSCEYCLSAHSAIGKMVGLKPEEIATSREAHSADAKRDAGLQFVQALVVQRGMVSDQAVAHVKAAGFSDGDIAEIVANVAVNIFTNYFNLVAQTEVDFPRVSLAMEPSVAVV